MKKTALNYLIEVLELKVLASNIPWVDNVIKKAIEMEREQIASAYENGEWNQGVNGDANEYIEKTYESNE
jgi:hypothetical protein